MPGDVIADRICRCNVHSRPPVSMKGTQRAERKEEMGRCRKPQPLLTNLVERRLIIAFMAGAVVLVNKRTVLGSFSLKRGFATLYIGRQVALYKGKKNRPINRWHQALRQSTRDTTKWLTDRSCQVVALVQLGIPDQLSSRKASCMDDHTRGQQRHGANSKIAAMTNKQRNEKR